MWRISNKTVNICRIIVFSRRSIWILLELFTKIDQKTHKIGQIHIWNPMTTSLRSCPLPIIPLCLSREEGMIHFFVGSHVKKPESELFSDLCCSNWPKCSHPLVVVDFSLHFCLRNEQWIHTRVRYEISARSVFLNLKNAWIEVSSIEILTSSSYTKTVAVKTSPIIWMQFDTGNKLQKRQTGSLFK